MACNHGDMDEGDQGEPWAAAWAHMHNAKLTELPSTKSCKRMAPLQARSKSTWEAAMVWEMTPGPAGSRSSQGNEGKQDTATCVA